MEDVVMVPVPKDRLMEVYAVLGKDGGGERREGPEPPDAFDHWDAAEFRRHVGRASDTIKGLVKYLADHAGEEVTTTDVAEELQLPHGWNSLAGALGAFGRYLGNRDRDWPWETWWDADGRAVMRMSEAVAIEVHKAGL